jgi:hypothetical protein
MSVDERRRVSHHRMRRGVGCHDESGDLYKNTWCVRARAHARAPAPRSPLLLDRSVSRSLLIMGVRCPTALSHLTSAHQDAVDLARQHALPIVGAEEGAGGLGDRAATAAAKAIAQTALERGSMDNITVVVMTLLRSPE